MTIDEAPTKADTAEVETEARSSAPAAAPDPLFSAEEVSRILDFHGTPVAAQVLREVLGTLGRTAAWASRKQPKNRPEFLRAWNPPHLRQLAELCQTYAPEVGALTSPRDQREDEGAEHAANASYVIAGAPLPHEVDAEVSEHEAQVMAERAAQGKAEEGAAVAILTEQLGAVALPVIHEPDPAPEIPEALVGAPAHLPVIHWAEPQAPANAEESRSLIGREQGDPPF